MILIRRNDPVRVATPAIPILPADHALPVPSPARMTPRTIAPVSPYATADELAQILHVDATARAAELNRALEAAAYEIDRELGLDAPLDSPPALVQLVNLDRAVEHWAQSANPFGLLGTAGETVPAFATEDTWRRHAHKLAPLKEKWGIA